MNTIRTLIAGASLSLLSTLACAAAVDVGGVRMEDSAELRGTKLELNGAGVRYKAVFKVYAAGLYLTEKKTSVAEVLATSGPRRVAITMLREVSSDDFGKAFMEGLNSVFSAVKRKARGYRSTEYLVTMLYFVAGKLEIPYYG